MDNDEIEATVESALQYVGNIARSLDQLVTAMSMQQAQLIKIEETLYALYAGSGSRTIR